MNQSAVVVLLLMVISSCVHGKNAASCDDGSCAQFIAGVSLLQIASPRLDGSDRTRRYRELRRITGCTRDEVLEYLRRIRSDPEKGKELFSLMRDSFIVPTDTLH